MAATQGGDTAGATRNRVTGLVGTANDIPAGSNYGVQNASGNQPHNKCRPTSSLTSPSSGGPGGLGARPIWRPF